MISIGKAVVKAAFNYGSSADYNYIPCMETLSPAEGCFVNNVFITGTGHRSGGALPGRWPNFAASLNRIGVLTRGVDAIEHIHGNGRAPVRLEFVGVALDLAERVRASGLISDSTIGIARRYRLPGGAKRECRDSQDVMWIFHHLAGFNCCFGSDRSFLSIDFVGELKDIKILGRVVSHPQAGRDRRIQLHRPNIREPLERSGVVS
ncbi:MAG: hypothetical protein ABI791_14915 [Acidobacteriota bacterium]